MKCFCCDRDNDRVGEFSCSSCARESRGDDFADEITQEIEIDWDSLEPEISFMGVQIPIWTLTQNVIIDWSR